MKLIFKLHFTIIDGFRKIVDPQSGSLKQDKDEWEFFHPCFQQNKPELLQEIKRKVITDFCNCYKLLKYELVPKDLSYFE